MRAVLGLALLIVGLGVAYLALIGAIPKKPQQSSNQPQGGFP